MKIVDAITCKYCWYFRKFPEILNFWKIYNLSCTRPTLIDQSELLVLHLRKMSCDTTLSLCGHMMKPTWPKPFQLLCSWVGTLKACIAGRWIYVPEWTNTVSYYFFSPFRSKNWNLTFVLKNICIRQYRYTLHVNKYIELKYEYK